MVVLAPISTSSSMTTGAGLRDLLVGAVGAVGEAEAVGADDRAVLHDTRAPRRHASRIDTRAWMRQSGPISASAPMTACEWIDRAGADARAGGR